MTERLTFDAPELAASFRVNTEKRTISGLAVPWGKVARNNFARWRFMRGSLHWADDAARIKLNKDHDRAKSFAYAVRLQDTEVGLDTTFKVARGALGDDALQSAEDRVDDGLSIEIDFEDGDYFTEDDDGVRNVHRATLRAVGLTAAPAFDDARVASVAASRTTEGHTMSTTTTPPATDATAQTTGPQTNAAAGPVTIQLGEDAQFGAAVAKAIEDGFASMIAKGQIPGAGKPASLEALPEREIVAAGGAGAAQFKISEELPYRFDGMPGKHSFSEDMRDMANGDPESKDRIDKFLLEVFAVTTGNVTALNPTKNRPELYVPQLEYSRPLFESVSTGPIADKTPFTVPKFNSATGLVGDHTEGTEPTPGAFTATSQTITPTAISGKVEINREVWDQGGSPQADQIIWGEMLRGYFEAIETKIAAMLNALAAATLYTGAEINLGGAVNDALQDALIDLFVDLQFVRGGNRYTGLVLDGQLFPAIAKAKDTTGRLLFPVLGATNAAGDQEGNFSEVRIGTQRGRAAWALGAATTSHSYLFVPSSVWQWVSPPRRFSFEYQVKSVDMAIWGYQAGAVIRNSDVARLDYTTSDV